MFAGNQVLKTEIIFEVKGILSNKKNLKMLVLYYKVIHNFVKTEKDTWKMLFSGKSIWNIFRGFDLWCGKALQNNLFPQRNT